MAEKHALKIGRIVHTPLVWPNNKGGTEVVCRPAMVWFVEKNEYVKLDIIPHVPSRRGNNEDSDFGFFVHDATEEAPVPSWHWPDECKRGV